MAEESIFSYSELFKDDGGIETFIDKVKRMETFIETVGTNLKHSLSIADPKDTKEVDRLSKEVARLTTAYEQLQKAKKANEGVSKKAAQLRGKELIEMQKMRDAQQKENKEASAVAKIKNTQAGSIENMRAKLALVTIAWAKLSKEERENSERGQRLIKSKKELTEELKKVEKETGDTRRNVGNYTESVKEAVRELNRENAELTENITLLKQQQAAVKKGSAEWNQYEKHIHEAEQRLEKVNTDLGKGNKKGFGTGNMPDLGGIASGGAGGNPVSAIGSGIGKIVSKLGPVGLAIGAVVGGLTAGVNAVHQINMEFDTLRGTVQKLTGETGHALDSMVVSAKAVSVVFGQEVNDVIQAQNVLMKEFGISGEEAAHRIEQGFLSNANVQGDMLDNIKEYSAQIAMAGGEAEDLIAILDHAGTEGVFSNKGVDVMKEFGIKIREQAEGTRDALQNAFGKEFTDRVMTGIKDGSISTLDALAMISERMNDTSVNASNLQAVVSNVFGGPGEDAGLRYLQSLRNINQNMDELTGKTDEATQMQKKNLDAQKELAGVQNELSKAVGDTSAVGLVWTNIQIGMYKALLGIVNWLNRAIESFETFGGAMKFLGETALSILTMGLYQAGDATEELTIAQRQEMYVAIQMQNAIKDFIVANKKELYSIKSKIDMIGKEGVARADQIKHILELKKLHPEILADMNEENLANADLLEIKEKLNRRFTEEMILRKKNLVLMGLETHIKNLQARIDKTAEGELKDQLIRELNLTREYGEKRIAEVEKESRIFLGLDERTNEEKEDIYEKDLSNFTSGEEKKYKAAVDFRKLMYGETLEEAEKARSLELLQIERNMLALGATETEIQRALTRQKIMILNEELAILEAMGQQETETYINQQIQKYELQRQLDQQNRQIELERSYKQAEIDAEIRRNFMLKNEAAMNESNERIAELQAEYSETTNERRKAEIEAQIDLELEGQRKLFEEKKILMREQLDQEYQLKRDNAHNTIEDERLLNLELQRLEEEHNNALFELDQQHNSAMKDLNDQAIKDEITAWENFEKKMQDIYSKILDKMVEVAEKEKQLAQERVSKQDAAVTEQERRAEAGLTNTLAFEQKQMVEREKELIEREKELQRRQKAKAIYAGYTNYANQGEENPLGKALADQAVLEAIEATFGGFYKGEYTGDGNPHDVAGVVHKGEWVVDAKTTKALKLKGKSMGDFKRMMAGGMYAPAELGALGTDFFSDQNMMFKESAPVIDMDKMTSKMDQLIKITANKPDHAVAIQETIEGQTKLIHKITSGKNTQVITRTL